MGIHVDSIIRAAIERGEMENLPHHGEPLELDEDGDVPPELRMTYRILKNAGYVPAEVEEMQAIFALRQELKTTEDSGEQGRIQREIQRRLVVLATRVERLARR